MPNEQLPRPILNPPHRSIGDRIIDSQGRVNVWNGSHWIRCESNEAPEPVSTRPEDVSRGVEALREARTAHQVELDRRNADLTEQILYRARQIPSDPLRSLNNMEIIINGQKSQISLAAHDGGMFVVVQTARRSFRRKIVNLTSFTRSNAMLSLRRVEGDLREYAHGFKTVQRGDLGNPRSCIIFERKESRDE